MSGRLGVDSRFGAGCKVGYRFGREVVDSSLGTRSGLGAYKGPFRGLRRSLRSCNSFKLRNWQVAVRALARS